MFLLFLALALALQPVPTKTIIDVLSSSPEFSDILNLIQLRGLVPFFNQQYNSTFLAPVNSAFIGIDKSKITRDQILYHFVNKYVPSEDLVGDEKVYFTYLDNSTAPIKLSLKNGANGESAFGDVDLMASPGRGLVHCLLQIVNIPLTVEEYVRLDPNLSDFSQIADFNLDAMYLVPTNNAIERWLENSTTNETVAPLLNYLSSSHGSDDAQKFAERHALVNNKLFDGTPIEIDEDWQLSVGDVKVQLSVEVARNGVYSVIGEVLSTDASDFLSLTPEKIILGLGGYSMVRELSLYGMSDLIDGSDKSKRTIVVPASHPEVASSSEYENPGSIILYQFLKGKFPKKKQSTLLDTKLPLKNKKYLQRVHYNRRASGFPSLNWEKLDKEEYRLGNTTFYVSHDLITPPPSLAMALGPMLVSSYSLSFLDKLNRLQLPHDESYTVLVPNRESWEKNILLKYYLDSNSTALSLLFDNLILKAPIYSDQDANITVGQFGGIETEVMWDSAQQEFRLNNTEIQKRIQVEVTDALFNNGVAHVVEDIPLPTNLEVSTLDLILAGKRTLFVDLLHAAGMDHVLEPYANYTVLVPPNKDLRKNNYTVHTDPKKLKEMLELHLLPDNPIGDLFNGGSASTLSGEDLEVQSIGSSKLLGLTPKDAAEGQRILLYKYGYTNGIIAGGSSVVFTDRHISPHWLTPIRFGLRRATYTILGFLFGMVLACLFLFGGIWYLSKGNKEPILLDDDGTPYRDEEEEVGADGEIPRSGPIETPGVSEGRAYARHIDFPQ